MSTARHGKRHTAPAVWDAKRLTRHDGRQHRRDPGFCSFLSHVSGILAAGDREAVPFDAATGQAVVNP